MANQQVLPVAKVQAKELHAKLSPRIMSRKFLGPAQKDVEFHHLVVDLLNEFHHGWFLKMVVPPFHTPN